jgi:hypothetical protein
LQLRKSDNCAVFNVAKGKLEDAPGFDKEHWPSMADQQWAQTVNSYYGVPTHHSDRL